MKTTMIRILETAIILIGLHAQAAGPAGRDAGSTRRSFCDPGTLYVMVDGGSPEVGTDHDRLLVAATLEACGVPSSHLLVLQPSTHSPAQAAAAIDRAVRELAPPALVIILSGHGSPAGFSYGASILPPAWVAARAKVLHRTCATSELGLFVDSCHAGTHQALRNLSASGPVYLFLGSPRDNTMGWTRMSDLLAAAKEVGGPVALAVQRLAERLPPEARTSPNDAMGLLVGLLCAAIEQPGHDRATIADLAKRALEMWGSVVERLPNREEFSTPQTWALPDGRVPTAPLLREAFRVGLCGPASEVAQAATSLGDLLRPQLHQPVELQTRTLDDTRCERVPAGLDLWVTVARGTKGPSFSVIDGRTKKAVYTTPDIDAGMGTEAAASHSARWLSGSAPAATAAPQSVRANSLILLIDGSSSTDVTDRGAVNRKAVVASVVEGLLASRSEGHPLPARVYVFDGEVREVDLERLLTEGSGVLDEALAAAGGCTDLGAPIVTASNALDALGAQGELVFVTDGCPTCGPTQNLDELRALAAKAFAGRAHFHVIALTDVSDRQYTKLEELQAIARATSGGARASVCVAESGETRGIASCLLEISRCMSGTSPDVTTTAVSDPDGGASASIETIEVPELEIELGPNDFINRSGEWRVVLAAPGSKATAELTTTATGVHTAAFSASLEPLPWGLRVRVRAPAGRLLPAGRWRVTLQPISAKGS